MTELISAFRDRALKKKIYDTTFNAKALARM
jgi:hypothetical protein